MKKGMEPELVPGAAAPPKILLVDDVAAFLELGKALFANRPVSVLTARDGHEALRVTKAERPLLVMVDEGMPGPRGHEVCRAIKGDPELADTSVVIVTANADDETIDRCMEAGCDDYVCKPITRAVILKVAEKFLNTRRRLPMRMMVRMGRVADAAASQASADTFFGYTVDISDRGILVECSEPLQSGDLCELSFYLPGAGGKVVTRGRVVRILPRDGEAEREVGLEFLRMDAASLASIQQFVARQGGAATRILTR